MAKKKDKPQVINNIQELNLEIDYDKLAEAIVKAQGKQVAEIEEMVKSKCSIWKKIGCFIINQNPSNKETLINYFKFPIVWFFRIITLTCLVLFPAVIEFSIGGMLALPIKAQSWSDWVFYIEIYLLIPVFILGFGISTWAAANQFSREKDKNFVLTLFSGVISFVALIIAVIALFKGVG